MMHVSMDGGSSPRTRRCHVSLDARASGLAPCGEQHGGGGSANFVVMRVSVERRALSRVGFVERCVLDVCVCVKPVSSAASPDRSLLATTLA